MWNSWAGLHKTLTLTPLKIFGMNWVPGLFAQNQDLPNALFVEWGK